jgi:hypothetical protein
MQSYVDISYDFYKEYLTNLDFKNKLNTRIEAIEKRYSIKNKSLEIFLEDYFVEVFSWSILTKSVLNFIYLQIKEQGLQGVIDPCCGNGFHTYLFGAIMKLNTYTVDIQDEEDSWTSIVEKEGRQFLKELSQLEHENNALILSWIDYESLTIDLLNLYKGNMIISIGNYDKLSPNYISELKKQFNMSYRFILNMPWGLTEKIEIYIKK